MNIRKISNCSANVLLCVLLCASWQGTVPEENWGALGLEEANMFLEVPQVF